MFGWKTKIVMRALAAIVVTATALLPVCARDLQPLTIATPDQAGMSAERLGRISATFKNESAEGKLPGAVILVARKGKIIYSDAIGFQDKGANTPLKPDLIFRIYSMTKPLASVAAMMLVEDGVLQLTDPVSKFLPPFKDMQVSVASTGAEGKPAYTNIPAAKPIIVQDLLRHSAGLAYAEITKNEPVKAAYVEANFSQPGVHEYDSRGMTPAQQVERIARDPAHSSARNDVGIQHGSRYSRPCHRVRLQTGDLARSRMSGCSSRLGWWTPASGFRHQRCLGWRSRCQWTLPRARRRAFSMCQRSR